MSSHTSYRRASLALAGLVLLLPMGAMAQGEVTVYGGGTHFGDGGGSHATVGGAAGINAGQNLQLFGEFNYVPLGSSSFSFSGAQSSGSSKLLNFGGGAMASIGAKGSKVLPYVLGVVGDGHFTSSASSSYAGQSVSFSGSDNSVYAGGGAGVRIFVAEHWGFRPEFRYQRYLQNGGANVFMFTGGLFYQFGK